MACFRFNTCLLITCTSIFQWRGVKYASYHNQTEDGHQQGLDLQLPLHAACLTVKCVLIIPTTNGWLARAKGDLNISADNLVSGVQINCTCTGVVHKVRLVGLQLHHVFQEVGLSLTRQQTHALQLMRQVVVVPRRQICMWGRKWVWLQTFSLGAYASLSPH